MELVETGRPIAVRFRLAGKSTAYFATFTLAHSILAWLFLDAFFPCDPVSALLLWLGISASRGGRRSATLAVIVSCLYVLLPLVILHEAQLPPFSSENLKRPSAWADILYCALLLPWASFNIVALLRALVTGRCEPGTATRR